MIHIGDKLVCHKAVVMNGTRQVATTVNKIYIVTDISDYDFNIKNDQDEDHSFNIEKGKGYYRKWFLDTNKVRKKKLNKLKNVNS